MPISPKKPCAKPFCGVLVSRKDRFCREHNNNKTNYSHTKTSTDRGYGYGWQKLRKIVFLRDNKLCQICFKAGRITEAYAVDHIKPKTLGGDDSMDNLQSLCKECHNTKTAKEDSKGRAGKK